MKPNVRATGVFAALSGFVVVAAVTFAGPVAFAAGVNGTTLAGYKTIDICTVDDATWRYSGEIAVWNEGVLPATVRESGTWEVYAVR